MTRRVLLGLAVLLLVPAASIGVLVASFDPNSLKPRIADAVRLATGRELTLAGPLRLSWSLIPTVIAEDVRFANLPGLSRPDMLTVARVEARVALLPLLSRRVDLRRVLLVQPDLLLEQDASGRPNWRFDRPEAVTTTVPSEPRPSAGTLVSLQELRIEAGQVAARLGAGEPVRISLPSLAATALAADAPLAVVGTVAIRDVAFAVSGTTGPVLALQGGAQPWPIRFQAAGGGLDLAAEGAVGPGGTMLVQAKAADLARLGPLVGRPLPPLRGVEVTARLAGGALAEAALRVGGSSLAPGVRLEALALKAPAPDAPVALDGALHLGGTPVQLAGTLGTLSALLSGGPLPLDVRADAGHGATASVRGALAGPRALDGLDVLVSARVPDLAALGPASGNRLPLLRDLAFDARLTAPAGLAQGIALRGLRLAAPAGDLSGDVAFTWAPRPSLRGTLVSRRLDPDALQAALRPRSQGDTAAPPPAAVAPPRTRVFPDDPLPFEILRAADADLQLTLAELVLAGAAYRGIETRLALQAGQLRLDPFAAAAPGGRLEGAVEVDASLPEPAATLRLRSPGLALGPLLAAFGRPEGGSGSLGLDLDLRGVGRSPHALASTLGGHLGATLVDGELDGQVLAAALGEALRAADLPVELGGRIALRCLALRAEAASGIVTLRALLLDTARLRVEGGGTIDLGAETSALQLRPLLRLGGTGVELPIRVGGTLLRPQFALDAGSSGRISAAIGALAPPPPDACTVQLALARGGRAGPVPAAAPEAARPVNPVDLLRNLLR